MILFLIPGIALSLIALSGFVVEVKGHGRLIEPPSRASMWRYGFDTPIDYNDNQLFCGGAGVSTVSFCG